MTNPHTPDRQRQRWVEELLACLHTVEDQAGVIIRQAYEFGDEEIFSAGKKQKVELTKMRRILETKWQVLDKRNRAKADED